MARGIEMAEESTGRRHRSPAYPAVALDEALDRLMRLYGEQKRATVHLDAAYESIGYKTGSSSGARVIAALKSYGLVSDEGSGNARKVRITDSGYKLVVLDREDSDWLKAVQAAALSPKLFRDLTDLWPDGLPSDSAIRNYLLLDLNFNPDAIAELIKDFRSTYELAKLARPIRTENPEVDVHESHDDPMEGSAGNSVVTPTGGPNPPSTANDRIVRGNPSIPDERLTQTYTIPISGGKQATLQVPNPLSTKGLEMLKRYLELMGEAMVVEE